MRLRPSLRGGGGKAGKTAPAEGPGVEQKCVPQVRVLRTGCVARRVRVRTGRVTGRLKQGIKDFTRAVASVGSLPGGEVQGGFLASGFFARLGLGAARRSSAAPDLR
jgi:hypothetical protein